MDDSIQTSYWSHLVVISLLESFPMELKYGRSGGSIDQ